MKTLFMLLSALGFSCKANEPAKSQLASIAIGDALYFTADNGETVCRLSCPKGQCVGAGIKALNAKTFFQTKGVVVPLLIDLYSLIHSLSMNSDNELQTIALRYGKRDISSTLTAVDRKFSQSTNKKALESCLASASHRGADGQITGAKVEASAVIKARASMKISHTASKKPLPLKRYRTEGHATNLEGCIDQLKSDLTQHLGRYGFRTDDVCQSRFAKQRWGFNAQATRYIVIKNGVPNSGSHFFMDNMHGCLTTFGKAVSSLFPEAQIAFVSTCTETFTDASGDERTSFRFSFTAWPGLPGANAPLAPTRSAASGTNSSTEVTDPHANAPKTGISNQQY